MQTFIALSGNLTRATIEAGEDTIPVVAMLFTGINDEQVEVIVEEAALLPWLQSAVLSLEAQEETAAILADPVAMAAIAEAESDDDLLDDYRATDPDAAQG